KEQYKKWDSFAYSHPYSSIHQTSRWAHFQSNVAARDKFWIIGIFDEDKSTKGSRALLAGTVLIRHKMPKGYTWLYAPRGPLLDYDNPEKAKEQMKVLLSKIKEIAQGEKTIFFRIDPLVEIQNAPEKKRSIHFPKFHFSHLGYQPEDTLILDITKSEDEILSQMKEKGRYNIRLAGKKGVKIIEVKSGSPNAQAQIEAYYEILQETLERDKFHGHGISFYKNMVDKLAPKKTTNKINDKSCKDGFSRMLLAYYTEPETHKQIPLAGIIATFYKDTGIYYFGASSNAYRNLMAPYLLQWHAMKMAKSLGLTKYDLLGIAPETPKDPLGPKNHHWRGVTEFKRKFGGTYIKYLPPQDFAFKPLIYIFYVIAKKLRRMIG
ncbi:MAG TPA: peptidoglycan bridge formation glycyltransferase FemA/FemB family protein, partial [Candidatus Gracilibacteria bacterium]|nr:peptidoglycan bridge formation glycyltransferase FemA/FemB family protein [Candidatus Gracilibacteria bacterium]